MKGEKRQGSTGDHLANERTYLAWIRTSIGIMAFGFVVERFALFMKQMSVILGTTTLETPAPPTSGYSVVVGIFLVGLGILLALLSFLRYKKVEKQINSDTFQPSSLLDLLLTLAILAVGIFLIAYLIHSL
ncbi:MAG: hypothetical protein FD170_1756 [Bacteroidetes bacterium]|nr:MAG: hypothetical protein FD170_1756 [Bacteroidota bacterium]